MFFSAFLRTFAILLAFLVFFFFLIIIFAVSDDINSSNFILTKGEDSSSESIIVINLNGPIVDDSLTFISFQYPELIYPSLIKNYLNEIKIKKPKVIIFRVNSPGGTVSASNKIYNLIDDFKKENDSEIIFYTDNLLTSGGYWIALSGHSIIANYGSILGSIGVSGPQWIFFNEPISISTGYLGEKIDTKEGIEIFSQNAGKSKDLFNPFRKPTEEELNHLKSLTTNIYEDFLLLVSKKRKIEKNYLKNQIGALIFDTELAKKNYLIDDVLDFDLLLEKIKTEKNLNDYNIYTNKKKDSLLKNFISSNYKDSKNIDLCDTFESNFSVISPKFLSSC